MDEAKALLKAICGNPDDDTARLVYADWLDEHGDSARAEFIRVQVELARMEGDDPRRPAFARREQELQFAHALQWGKGLPERAYEVRFRRGFVDEVDFLDWGVSTDNWQMLFAAHPVTVVRMHGDNAQLRRVARWPSLARVRDFGFSYAHPRGLNTLLGSQFSVGLRGLHLQELGECDYLTRLGDFLPVLELPHLNRIIRLTLHFSAVNLQEVRRFVRLGMLRRLHELTLFCDVLGETTARELAGTAAVAGLRTLRLPACRLGDAGVQHLADSPHLAGLRRLSLVGARRITDDGFRGLARSPHLRNLTDLDLRYTQITHDGVEALARSPFLTRLARLMLTGTPAAEKDAQLDFVRWDTCAPDEHTGVLWVSELRQA